MISVITTCYNGQRYLPNLLKMLSGNVRALEKAGIGEKVEYILVNDSPWIPLELSQISEGLSVRVINNAQNLGIHGSRVAGIRESRGEYITILDQDDEIMPTFLVSQYRALGDGDAVICNGFKELTDSSRPIYKDRVKMSLVNCKDVYLLAANQIVSPGQSLLRRSMIPASWLENPMKINGSDDLFLWLLYLQQGVRFRLNFEKLYIHKQVGDNLSNSLEKMCQSDEEMCRILQEQDLLPQKDIQKRRRLCRFLAEGNYKSNGSMKSCLKYPDIAAMKLFAYYI